MRVADVLELVRAPAAFSAVGDSLTGAYAQGPVGPRQLLLPVASVLIYAGGMGLNDWSDRELDAEERPERPIPSGRVSPEQALAISAGLLGGGVAWATLVGGRSGALRATLLAATVVTYDTVAKDTALGSWVMAACRSLNVLLGASSLPAAISPALTIGAHTVAVTELSRAEVTGADRSLPEGVRIGVAGVAGAAALGGRNHPSALRTVLGRIAGAAATYRYLDKAVPPLSRAIERPGADRIRDAVRANLGALIPLQAALIARTGNLVPAAAVASLELAQRQVIRRLRGDTT